MKIESVFGPSGTAALCHFQPGDKLTAEGGSMMAMSPGLDLSTSTYSRGSGGVLKGIKRLLSGESFFLNHYEARTDSRLWLSTPLPGDILIHELRGERLIVSGGSYLASGSGIHIDMSFQGFKGFLTGENLFWLKADGTGPLLLGAFGEIYPVAVEGEYIVDTGHIVAFQETLDFSISKSGTSWLHSFLGGEGLVCRFKGHGTVWCQSHNPHGFGGELTPYLRPRS